MASGGKSDDEITKEERPAQLHQKLVKSPSGYEAARTERSKQFSKLKDITAEGGKVHESELDALVQKNQQLTSQRNEWKAKYEELVSNIYDEPTVQQQPTNHNLQQKYEMVCANLNATPKESAGLLKQVKELKKNLGEKYAEIAGAKLRIEELEKNQLEMNNNENREIADARLQIKDLTTQLESLQEILNAVLEKSEH